MPEVLQGQNAEAKVICMPRFVRQCRPGRVDGRGTRNFSGPGSIQAVARPGRELTTESEERAYRCRNATKAAVAVAAGSRTPMKLSAY